MTAPDLTTLAAIAAALALGGLLKGATGAGAPVIAVPVLAAIFDVRFAVALMALPNLLVNLRQVWSFRDDRLPRGFSARFAAGGAIGVVLGTYLLAVLSADVLSILVGLAVLAYIGLRLLRPAAVLRLGTAHRVSLPVGLAAGALQGAAGVSAPISLGFLNAMRLDRLAFIATISVFFAAISAVQLASLVAAGLLDVRLLTLGAMATVPLLVAMPLGQRLARSLSPKVFDRIMLLMLSALALQLVGSVIWHA